MIANPPHIQELLFHWQHGLKTSEALTELFRRHLGRLAWEDFLQTYHLYLQSIPMELAREAWGLTQTDNPAQP